MDAKSDIFVEMLKLMAAFISGFTVFVAVHKKFLIHNNNLKCKIKHGKI